MIDLRSIKPLDTKTILKSVNKTKKLLVVDNGWSFCGLSSEIISQISINSKNSILMDRLTFLDIPCPTAPNLESEFYPSPEKIVRKIESMLKIKKKIKLSNKDKSIKEVEEFKGPF